jgi:hypothetical protein
VTDVISPFLEGAVRTATPLAFAALGETVVERSGIINIGLEGAIICGAFGGLVASTHQGTWLAIVAAGISGMMVSMLFAFFVTRLRSDQIITGTAISLLSLGLTGTLYRQIYGPAGSALTTATMPVLPVPFLSSLPLIGSALFSQPPITYVLYVLVSSTVVVAVQNTCRPWIKGNRRESRSCNCRWNPCREHSIRRHSLRWLHGRSCWRSSRDCTSRHFCRRHVCRKKGLLRSLLSSLAVGIL